MIFVTSDHHFGHANILKFKRHTGGKLRPKFKTVDEMNRLMIERWNSVVGPHDTVWHLGDFIWGPFWLPIIRQLNGKKHLVLGNHDHHVSTQQLLHSGVAQVYGVKKVDGVLLSHCPLRLENLGGCGNLHGHIHDRESPEGPYLNMSVERWRYTPVEWSRAKRHLKKNMEKNPVW
jgi:calcineurin-like phosphoesterase family protein